MKWENFLVIAFVFTYVVMGIFPVDRFTTEDRTIFLSIIFHLCDAVLFHLPPADII